MMTRETVALETPLSAATSSRVRAERFVVRSPRACAPMPGSSDDPRGPSCRLRRTSSVLMTPRPMAIPRLTACPARHHEQLWLGFAHRPRGAQADNYGLVPGGRGPRLNGRPLPAWRVHLSSVQPRSRSPPRHGWVVRVASDRRTPAAIGTHSQEPPSHIGSKRPASTPASDDRGTPSDGPSKRGPDTMPGPCRSFLGGRRTCHDHGAGPLGPRGELRRSRGPRRLPAIAPTTTPSGGRLARMMASADVLNVSIPRPSAHTAPTAGGHRG